MNEIKTSNAKQKLPCPNFKKKSENLYSLIPYIQHVDIHARSKTQFVSKICNKPEQKCILDKKLYL